MIQAVRGTRDFLPNSLRHYHSITKIACEQALRYGFEEIATPLLEFQDLFCRSAGETSDVVMKEMYHLTSRGGEEMVLRPEGTASVLRAILSQGLTQTLPLKFFYQGPMFRYNRPQKGRLRQFHQFGIEYLGVTSPWADVEVLSCAVNFLKDLDILPLLTLELNTLGDLESRTLYRQNLVTYFEKYADCLSLDSQTRLNLNPLRILDSKDPGDQQIIQQAPHLKDSLTAEAGTFFETVQQGLTDLGIVYTLNPYLVRGLDYYTHTAFEFTASSSGAQSTVLAGGRYDGLMELLGGPSLPGIGWACGIERLMLLKTDASFSPQKVAFLPADDSMIASSFQMSESLRQQGFIVEIFIEGPLKKKLKKASQRGCSMVLIWGEDEKRTETILVKGLETGHQETVSLEHLSVHLTTLLKR